MNNVGFKTTKHPCLSTRINETLRRTFSHEPGRQYATRTHPPP
jgi:hypothetical protein